MFPSEKKEILIIERKLTEIWIKKEADERNIKEFRELLKRWYYLHLYIIEKYKKQSENRKKNYLVDVVL